MPRDSVVDNWKIQVVAIQELQRVRLSKCQVFFFLINYKIISTKS